MKSEYKFYHKRSHTFLLFLLCFIFSSIFYWSIGMPSGLSAFFDTRAGSSALGILCVSILVILNAFVLYKLCKMSPDLVINNHGLSFSPSFLTIFFIPWESIDDIKEVYTSARSPHFRITALSDNKHDISNYFDMRGSFIIKLHNDSKVINYSFIPKKQRSVITISPTLFNISHIKTSLFDLVNDTWKQHKLK